MVAIMQSEKKLLKKDTTTHSFKERVLFSALVCWLILTGMSPYCLSNVFLPVYNEAHNVSLSWSGFIIGGPSVSLILVCFICPIAINKVPVKNLYLGATLLLSFTLLGAGMLDFISDTPYFRFLLLAATLTIGLGSGVVQVTGFFSLVSFFPRDVSVATALGELSMSATLAMGPFLGSFLYSRLGYMFAYLVPGALILLSMAAVSPLPQIVSTTDRKDDISTLDLLRKVASPWVLFPAWHVATCQLVFNFPTPLLASHIEGVFGKGANSMVWAGTIVLVTTACRALAAILWGRLIDKVSPYPPMIFSSLAIPITALCIGPCPPIPSSMAQLFVVLCVLGTVLPSGFLPAMTVMREAYQIQHKTGPNLSPQVSSALVAVYCASHSLGVFLGFSIGGVIAEHLSFPHATSLVAGVYLVETVACLVYCVRMKMSRKQLGMIVIVENKVMKEEPEFLQEEKKEKIVMKQIEVEIPVFGGEREAT